MSDRSHDPDAELLGALREALGTDGPPPEWEAAAAAAWSWRTIDAELAELRFDSAAAGTAGTRHTGVGARHVSFASGDAVIDVELGVGAEGLRIVGQLVPPAAAPVRVVRPDGTTAASTDADELGRFRFADLAPGPLSLVAEIGGRAVKTGWVDPRP